MKNICIRKAAVDFFANFALVIQPNGFFIAFFSNNAIVMFDSCKRCGSILFAAKLALVTPISERSLIAIVSLFARIVY